MPLAVVGCLWATSGVAQTPASQQNESQWKQTPEGRAAAGPSTPMNCSATVSRGDGKTTTTSNCPAAQDKPVPSNAAQQFPYPGDAQTPAAAAPSPQQNTAPSQPSSKQFPYPGDTDAQPASSSSPSSSSGDVKPPNPGGLRDAGSSGSSSRDDDGASSSSSSSSSSSDSGVPSDDTGAANATRAARKRLPPTPRITPTQRELEDLQVAGLYQNDGNFRGAYMRAKDAVSIAADDPDAHLALAEAARRLGKLDEAEQNYKRCLELDPVPKTRKAAEKALKEMMGGA